MTAFFSSSKIKLIQTVFKEVQQSDKVKHAQEILKGLRKEQDFEMTLATFMTRSNNCNERLLAMLELKKRVIIKDKQTFWILKNIYYQDIDKIAYLIRSIVSSTVNIELAGEFLNFDFDRMGVVEAIRYIQIVYSFLKRQQRYVQTIEYYFEQLYENLLALIEAVIENQDTFFMSIVTLGVFYRCSLQLNRSSYIERLRDHWKILEQKCKFYWTQNCSIIKMTIESLLYDRISIISSEQLFNLFDQTLKCLSSNNHFRTKYYGLMFNLVVQNLPLFLQRVSIYQLFNAFHQYSRRSNELMLMDSNFNKKVELNNFMQREIEDDDASVIRSAFSKVIQQFFQKYFRQFECQFGHTTNNGVNCLISIIHLLNFYNNTNHMQMKEWVESNMENVVNQIGQTINVLGDTFGDLQMRYINNCISIIQFLIKYKSLIAILLLPYTVLLLQQLSIKVSTLSPFCYNFMDHVWQDLASLDFDCLTDFLYQHVSKINRNQWDHRLSNYSGFLNLAKFLQQHYQFYSKFLIQNRLIQQSITAQKIMLNDVIQNELQELDHEIIGLLIEFTSYFVNGMCQQDFRSFYFDLNIPSLVKIIHQYKIYTIESAIIVAFDNFSNNRIECWSSVTNLMKDKDDPEFQYKIHLYLRQVCFCAPGIQISAKRQEVESIKTLISNLVGQLGWEKRQKLMRSTNWNYFLICSKK